MNTTPTLAARQAQSADSFLSALFHRLRDGVELALHGERANYALPVGAMPTAEHCAVFRALIAHAETGFRASRESLRAVLRETGFVSALKAANPFNADLIDDLPIIEGSGASLHYHARELLRLSRKRAQYARLWRKLRDLGDGDSAAHVTPPQTRRTWSAPRTAPRFSARAVAALKQGR